MSHVLNASYDREVLKHFPTFPPFPWICGDPVNRKKIWVRNSSGEHDGCDYSICSLVDVGGQEWMSLIMSAISLALTLACCLSFVQNGAERRRAVHAGWKYRLHGHWVTALSVPPGKHRAVGTGIWALSSLPVPYNRGTLMSFRRKKKSH